MGGKRLRRVGLWLHLIMHCVTIGYSSLARATMAPSLHTLLTPCKYRKQQARHKMGDKQKDTKGDKSAFANASFT